MALSSSNKRRRPQDTESVEQNLDSKRTKNGESSEEASHSRKDENRALWSNIATLDPQLLADQLAKQTSRFAQDLSPLELDELRIPVEPIVDTTSWRKSRTADLLPEFLKQYSGLNGNGLTLKNTSKEPGMPHTIVVSMSGLRAADLTRALRVLQTKDAIIAKLFAKHIKFKEAVEYTKKTRMSIGVGTPSRINDLLESGSLKTGNLERIVVDTTHIDQKKRSIMDMKDTQRPLLRLLCRSGIKDRYTSDHKRVTLLFF